jgi:hypothetical protein
LTNKKTINDWAGLGIEERQQMFHRRFPNNRISKYHLRLIYKQARIRKKKIRKTKIMTEKQKIKS